MFIRDLVFDWHPPLVGSEHCDCTATAQCTMITAIAHDVRAIVQCTLCPRANRLQQLSLKPCPALRSCALHHSTRWGFGLQRELCLDSRGGKVDDMGEAQWSCQTMMSEWSVMIIQKKKIN